MAAGIGDTLIYEWALFLLGETQIIYYSVEDILTKNEYTALYIRAVSHTLTST